MSSLDASRFVASLYWRNFNEDVSNRKSADFRMAQVAMFFQYGLIKSGTTHCNMTIKYLVFNYFTCLRIANNRGFKAPTFENKKLNIIALYSGRFRRKSDRGSTLQFWALWVWLAWLAWKLDLCDDVVKQNPMISIFRKIGSLKSDRGSSPLRPLLDPPLLYGREK